MNTFDKTQVSASVRATVLIASILMSLLCLGGVVVSFTWSVPNMVEIAHVDAATHA